MMAKRHETNKSRENVLIQNENNLIKRGKIQKKEIKKRKK